VQRKTNSTCFYRDPGDPAYWRHLVQCVEEAIGPCPRPELTTIPVSAARPLASIPTSPWHMVVTMEGNGSGQEQEMEELPHLWRLQFTGPLDSLAELDPRGCNGACSDWRTKVQPESILYRVRLNQSLT